ncbi:zinc finger domain-containing protein [Kitasatospora phosalacinea]|uniref:DNA-binding phage zinc finger domain-containing protein n=1 Tax=Kitasatospora phosalacinea TaxID=2065 RepID=A0A9W6PF59_9ACTN|nr:hypothetical protein [Kitasatospora phosalacinea]GLW53950.1 hypothetical protein Kpho01_19610 [Kitasatospora phosalacinea]
MTPDECAALLAYVGRLDPRAAQLDPAEAAGQLSTWCELLRDVPATAPGGWDAAATARTHITTSPFPILPVDVARPWAAHRRALMERHTDPAPAIDPDDVDGYRAAILAQRTAVATGQTAPSTSRQLTGGPHPSVAGLLAGRMLPPAAADALAPYRPVRAAREAAAAAGRPDALTVACEWCRARAGEPCRRRTYSRTNRAGTWHRRTTAHPCRIEAAERAAGAERAA